MTSPSPELPDFDAVLHPRRRLWLFTKPAVPGRVKTRLVGELSAEQTAELHRAFLLDVASQLAPEGSSEPGAGAFELGLAWALETGEPFPDWPELAGLPSVRQQGADLGQRLFQALSGESGLSGGSGVEGVVGAIGSDHPEIDAGLVARAFDIVDRGAADVALGPSSDGGYYLIVLAARALHPRLFADVAWSTEQVAATTLDRCRELGLRVHRLPEGHDVDLPEDLHALCRRLRDPSVPTDRCRHTRALLERWGWLESPTEELSVEGPPAEGAVPSES